MIHKMIHKNLRASHIPPITAFPNNGNNAGANNERNPLFDLEFFFFFFFTDIDFEANRLRC